MKKYIICIVAFMLTIATTAQTINTEISEEGRAPFLLGKINKNGLITENYSAWFSKNYDDYTLDTNTINAIKSTLKNYTITIFMGTWCGDSKQEVPRFYKVLEACDFPEEQLTVIAVSRAQNMYKQSPQHEEKGLNIHRVPTFIFYKNGKEVNRIVEHPVDSFEKDIEHIIITNNYKSNYQIVAQVNAIIEQEGLNALKRKRKTLVKTFANNVSSMYELNTYGRILLGTDRTLEAIEVYKLNTKLFPDQPQAYLRLAIAQTQNKQSKKAIKTLKKAIKQFPENQDLIKNLETLIVN
ncbi:MAG: thioredoxin family protein [Psychroserpens sp.]|uniref:thioredoxin family protein n=1 Tax=Psychroserpens sp. TaxID=2020870 RepID=UPI003C70873F